MSIYALTQDDAISLARQIPVDGVQLLGVDYNWGPPISGRYDTDYLNVWAAVSGQPEGTLFLQGQAGHGAWDLELPFQIVGPVQGPYPSNATVTVYSLSVLTQTQFPQQFVLRFDMADGGSIYDNNGGHNYALVPYHGRGGSAISTTEAIFVLSGIMPYQLYAH